MECHERASQLSFLRGNKKKEDEFLRTVHIIRRIFLDGEVEEERKKGVIRLVLILVLAL